MPSRARNRTRNLLEIREYEVFDYVYVYRFAEHVYDREQVSGGP